MKKDPDQLAPRDVDAYIQGFPQPTRDMLRKVRETVRKAAPQAEETLKYGIPTYVLGKNLVHFAGFKRHIGFYPTPSAIRYFEKQLAGYKSSKGAVQFPLGEPIPYGLIAEITRYRVTEVANG